MPRLVVYLDDVYYDQWRLQSPWWGSYRPDAMSQCGGASAVGFQLTGFFSGYPTRKVSMYWKDIATGALTEMRGSPKYCANSGGPNPCY